jgi:hypothetical protein
MGITVGFPYEIAPVEKTADEILPGSDFLQQFGQRPTPPGNRFEAQSAVACLGSQTP